MAAPGTDAFDAYFRRADLDQDGRISGPEAVAFFQGSRLPKQVLAQIWMHADQNRTGFLGRQEFYNALKLVTVAQSGRELTPDIVRAALGPAAAKIPAPQINPVSPSPAQMNLGATPPNLNSMVRPSTQVATMAPTASQNFGFNSAQALPSVGMNQQFFPSSNNHFMKPPQATPATGSVPMQGVNLGLPGRGSIAGPQLGSSNVPNLSTDWLGGRTSGTLVGGPSQVPIRGAIPSVSQDGFGLANSGPTPGATPKVQAPSTPVSLVAPKPLDPVLPSSQPAATDSKALVVSGNGISSDSIFGGDVFSATPQAKQGASTPSFSASSMTSSSTSVVSGSQNSVKPGQLDTLQGSSLLSSGGGQLQLTQSLDKQNLFDNVRSTSTVATTNVPVGPVNSASSQSQLPWPKFTQSDIRKYTTVFVEVDKDRDGKITGEQARNLFLSWRLPREVLKQVWDLSDQDNDSMLTHREFCTALYLMERYREGRPLPAALPNSIRFDETLLQVTGQPLATYGGPVWQPNPGLSQQGISGSRQVMPPSAVRPPLPNSVSSRAGGSVQSLQQKPGISVLDKRQMNQYSSEEQSAMNFQSPKAADTEKKVQEFEKEILDSKEKIEFYRTKMQELVLYKSRCDNRLNEITERASADKREVESLAKKYEEKYKQVGEIASKLTVEEATFRDIQERKLELQNAMVKMEQGGSVDGLLQVRADRIQYDLEELVKALNDRCKLHGLHVKQTASIELPFGWQPGIQEGAVDWDEDWDKFEDEGFTLAKDLTVEVENVGATGNIKSPTWSDKASADEVSPVASSSYTDRAFSTGERINQSGSTYAQSEGSARSPPVSPGRSILESTPQELDSSHFETHDFSPHAKGSYSDHGGAESTISGDKFTDDPSWGPTFDANDDVDSVWGFNPMRETDNERSIHNSFSGSGDFGLNPIRVDSPSGSSIFGKKKSPFFDSVPSTPAFDSNSPSRFNEGLDDHSFDNFSRFDSFSIHDSGFIPQRENLTRFDSMRSTRDSDHNRGFSFDDTDPFGSTGPFKASESHNSPRRGSDNWSAF